MDVKEMIKWLLNGTIQSPARKTIIVFMVVIVVSSCIAEEVEKGNLSSPAVVDVKDAIEDVKNGSDSGDGVLGFITNSVGHLGKMMDTQSGRTFGLPMRKLQAALLPIMFKLGVMATLVFLTFLLSLKSVGIGMLLLVFKIVSVFLKFKSDWHGGHQGWHPHKEVHLHMVAHPSFHGHEPYFSSSGGEGWNRLDTKKVSAYSQYVTHPSSSHQGITPHQGLTAYQGLTSQQGQSSYQGLSSHQGPSSVNTPYGHYVRTGDPTAPSAR